MLDNYVFVCIGTNKLLEDSFGPRVGEILKRNFNKNLNIRVFGTMNNPIHYQNAPIFVDYFKMCKDRLILIDSALADENKIGKTYINFGGLEIGKAFGKSLYFPADMNIKTVVGSLDRHCVENNLVRKRNYIDALAQNLANKITQTLNEAAII